MASTYLTRTPSSTGNQSTYTFSAWVKRSNISSFQGMISAFYDATGNRYAYFQFNDDDTITFFAGNYSTSTTTQSANKQTLKKFRDIGAFYHLVLAVDTTQGTAADRVKLYVNGVQETWDSGYTYNLDPSQNDIHFFNITTTAMQLGANNAGSYFDGSMAHVHWVDGTQYAASTFGETDSTTGIWKPKSSPSVTYGTNGFFMKFENSGSMGTDSSGNTNNLTVNGTPTQTVDTPSNNFATMNLLYPMSDRTLSNGNTTLAGGSATNWTPVYSTLGVSQGKWYFESKYVSGTYMLVGASYNPIITAATSSHIAGNAEGYGYWNDNGNKYNNNSGSAYGDSYTTGDIVGVALDLDNNYIYFSKNGVWQNSGDPTSGSSGTGAAYSVTSGQTYFLGTSTKNGTSNINYGNGYFGTTAVASAGTNAGGIGTFEYDVPSGYYALCTKNINTYG